MSQRYQLNANGPERPRVRANLHAFIDRLPEDKSFRVEIKLARKERTNPQNAALFGVAYPAIVEATGYTPDELHTAFCCKFFGTTHADVFGEKVPRPFRTTTTNEHGERDVMPSYLFAQFYELVQSTAADAGIDVPSPDPLHGQAGRWAA